MTDHEVSVTDPVRQGGRTGFAGLLLAVLLFGAGCQAPVSTLRSPYHLRVIEVRNTSGEPRTLKIEPGADQHLGASTTFTGTLKPGEVKLLYLYHGFLYDFRILDAPGHAELTRATFAVDRDMGILYDGDSLSSDAKLVVELGEPTMTFADSLQQLDPFGLRRASRSLEPDTSRGRRERTPEDQMARKRLGESP